MKRILGSTMVVVFLLTVAFAGTVSADSSGPLGPNPLAGDGYSDGSSLDAPNGPNGSMIGINQDS